MVHFLTLVFTEEGQSMEGLMLRYGCPGCWDIPREYLEFVECRACGDGCDGCLYDEGMGRCGRWDNPVGEWDWYVCGARFGSRWGDPLVLRDGSRSAAAKVGEVVWSDELLSALACGDVLLPDGVWHRFHEEAGFDLLDESDGAYRAKEGWVGGFLAKADPSWTVHVVDRHF